MKKERRKAHRHLKTTMGLGTTKVLLWIFLAFLVLAGISIYIYSYWVGIATSVSSISPQTQYLMTIVKGAVESVFILILVFIALTFLFLSVISQRLTGPIVRLTRIMGEVADRIYVNKFKFRKRDERIFQNLAENFNKVIDRITQDEEMLKKTLKHLENNEVEQAKSEIQQRLEIVEKNAEGGNKE